MANGNETDTQDETVEEQDLSNPENQNDSPSLASTNVNLFAEEAEASQIPKPVEHRGVDVESYLDYTGSDLNLLTDDAETIRAKNQPVWEQAGAFVNQAVLGEIVGGTVEGVGYLTDIKGMVDLAQGQEKEWGNWLSDIGKGIKEWTQDSTPIYQEEPGEFNPWDSGWWFGNGVSVASTIGLMIPSGLGLKGLQLIGKGAGAAARSTSLGSKLMNSGAKLARRAAQSSKFADDAASGITQAFLSRHAENMMEASQTFDEKYQNLLERGIPEEQARQRASEGASRVYGLNSAMVLQDIAQYTLLHRFSGGKAITPSEAGKAVSSAASRLPGGRYTALAGDFISEAGEEAYQYVAAEEGKYLADIGAGLRDPSEFSDRMREYISDGELMTSAFFGGFGSTLMQSVGPSVMNKLKTKTGGFEQDPLQFVQNYHAQMSMLDQQARAAREQGLDEQADYLEDRKVMGMTIANLDRGQEQAHLDFLRTMEGMNEDQAQQYADRMREENDIQIDPQSIMDKGQRHRELAEETVKTYNRIKNQYGQEIAGGATMNMMENKMNREKAKQKQQELSDHKMNIPEYEDLSPKGQELLDLETEVAGLERAEENIKKIIDQVDSDDQISSHYQTALENVQSNLETAKENLKREKNKEYDATEQQKDAQRMQDLDPFIDEGAKLVSEREIAEQVANVNRSAYNSKIQMGKDKQKSDQRRQKAQQKQDFKSNTVAADDVSTPMKQGDPVLFKGQPGEYVTSYEKGGMRFHKIRDLSDDKGTTWEVPENELDAKVEKRKYRQDVADEAEEEQNTKISRKEQDNVKRSNQQQQQKKTPEEQAEETPPTSPEERAQQRQTEPEPDELSEFQQRQIEGQEQMPEIPVGETQEELDKQEKTADAIGRAQGETGGNENILVPPNPDETDTQDPHNVSSTARQVKVESSLSVATSSVRNPKSQVRQALESGEITEQSERWKDAKALTDFLENQSPVVNPDGTYRYFVRAEIDKDLLNEMNPELRSKVDQRQQLTEAEIDQLPIKVTFHSTEDGSVVQVGGRDVYSYLHTTSYFTEKTLANPSENLTTEKQKLRNTRTGIYASYLDGTTQTAHVVKQEPGHFLRGENVELGDFETYNNVAEVLGRDAEDVNLAILDSGGVYTDQTGQALPELLSVQENAPERSGAVYASTVGANGLQKPMRLFVDKFTEAESDLVYKLYKDMTLGRQVQQTISDEVRQMIESSEDPRVSDLQEIMNLNDVSYGDLLNFMVYEGKSKLSGKGASQLWMERKGENSEVIFDTDGNISREEFKQDTKKKDFKDWLKSTRHRQIERKNINSPEYNRYLINNGIVRTTTAITENNRPLIGPTTVVGEFMQETESDEIDHIQDSNDVSQQQREEDTDSDMTIQDLGLQKPRMATAASLPDALSQRGITRMLDRLQERFNVNYQVIDNPDVNWAGRVEQGTVFINTAHATKDTPFHEFAHPLVQTIKNNNVRLYMGLSEEMKASPQGRQILNKVRNNYPDHNAEQRMDEAIVQSLGELASNNINEDESSFRRFLRDLWISLKRLMRKVFGVDMSVDPQQLDPTTSLRELSELLSDNLVDIDLSGIPMFAEQRPDGFTMEQYRDWVDSMTFMFIKSNTSEDISDISGARLDSIRDIIANTLNEMRTNDPDNPLIEQYQRVLNEITVPQAEGIEGPRRLDPNSKLLLAVQRKLKTYGIRPDQEVQPEERDSRLNIRASYEFSNKDKASVNTKLMVAMIPKLNSSDLVLNKFSKNGKKKPDYKLSPHTGLPQFHNFADTWNVLQATLANTVEKVQDGNVQDLYDVFRDKLSKASTLRPELQFLIKHLENAPEYKRTQFVQVLALAPQNFTSTFFRKRGDNFQFNVGGADTQSVSDQIIDQWSSNYRDTLAKTMKGKESGELFFVVDDQKATDLVERYNDLVQRTTEAAKTSQVVPKELKNDLRSLLEDTGISISERTVEKLIQDTSRGTTEIDKFNQILRGPKGSSIRFIYKEGGLSLENMVGKQKIIPEDGDVRLSITNEAFVRKMADAQSYFENNLADSTVLGPDNKPFWMYSNYNSMYKKIAEWKEDTSGLQKILSASYNGNSLWGQWLLESQENRDNFELMNFMNFRQEFSADRGNKNTELGITDLLSDKLNRTLQGVYSLPARADNTTEYHVKGPTAKKSFRVTDAGVELSDNAVNIIKDYLLDEISRIKHAENQVRPVDEGGLPESEWIRDYHYKLDENGNKDPSLGNAFKIHLMPSFNPLTQEQQQQQEEGNLDRKDNSNILFNSRGQLKTINTENFYNNAEVESVIRNSFKEQFQRDLQKMVDHRVITKKGEYMNNAIDVDKMDYYKGETGSEHLGVQAAIMDYTFNGIIANQEWHKLFGGDIASYKDRADFQKRATGPGSTGLIYRIMDDMSPTYNSAVVEDIIVPSDLLSDESIKAIAEYTGNTQKEIKSALQPYSEVDRADAQAWITPEQYRDRMRGYGKWTPEHERAFQRLQTGDQLPEDMSLFMQPLKTVHTEMRIQDKNNIFHYNKQSEAVLHPDIANSLNLGNLLVAMKQQGIDHVVVESGKKVGAQGITSIADESGNIVDTSDIELNGVELSKRHLFLQQELPTKGMKPAKEGSQIRKNILEGINVDGAYQLPDGTEMNGEDFLREIHSAIGALSDKGLQEVKDFIGWDGESYNQEKLYNVLQQAFTRREVDDNLMEALSTNMPLDAIPQMRVAIENQLASIINKKAVDLRHDTGGSYIQMTDVGWTTKLETAQRKMINWVNEEAKNGLKPPRIENGEFKPGQILLPHKIAKQMNLEGADLQKVMKDISTGVSYRIPNQSMSSNDVVEVVGILPESMGDTVVAYKEVTTKFGSDFDIDKLNVMLPNYRVTSDGVQVAEFKDIDTSDTGQLRELYREQYQSKINFFNYLDKRLTEKQQNLASTDTSVIDFFESMNDEDIVIDAERDVTLRDYNRLQREIANIPTEEEFVNQNEGASVYDVNSKEAVQNRKLELYRAMLSNPDTYFRMVKPLETDWLKNAIRENQPERDYSSDFEAFSPTTQAEIRKTFVDTKAAVGQVANHSTDHAFSQAANLFLNRKGENGNVAPHYIGIGNQRETEEGSATDLSGFTSENGEDIMETLSAFMTANVDASKDPYITDGNFNLFTNNVALFLARAGVPRQFIIDFMDQNIIREFAEVTAEYEGRTSQRYRLKDKGELTAQEYITYEYTDYLDERTTDISDVVDLDAIDPRQVMKNLREDPTNEDQINALALFLEWQNFASALNDSIQASKADVNGMGASITSANVKDNLKQKVIDEGIIGNFEQKFRGTFLENFHNNSITAGQQIFGNTTFLNQTQAVQDLVEDVSKKLGMYPLTSEDIAFTLNAEAYAYLMSGTDFAVSPEQLKSMFVGKNSMAKKLMRYKGSERSPIKDNEFVKYLGLKTADTEGGYDFVYGQGSKQLTTESKNELTEAWKDMLLHDNEAVRNFAKELGIYAYYSSGFRRNLTSFHELIPVELNKQLGIAEEIKRLQQDLETDSHPLAAATDQILKNLQDDGRIVPNLSSKSPNLRKLGNQSTRNIFGIVPSQSKWLQIGKDRDGNPVMKPYLNVGDRLFEYRGIGTKKEESDGVIKETKMAIYTPTSTLGLKSGRFRVKEYYKNLSAMDSAFEQNNIEKNEKVEDIVRRMGTVKNEVHRQRSDFEPAITEDDVNIESLLNTEFEFGEQEMQNYIDDFRSDSNNMTAQEYVEALKDNLNCK